MNKICDECETVAHCLKHGCIPKRDFCDENGNCNQGRDCPVRVAKVGQRVHGPELLPPSVWRYQLKKLACWMLLAIFGLTVWPLMLYLAMGA